MISVNFKRSAAAVVSAVCLAGMCSPFVRPLGELSATAATTVQNPVIWADVPDNDVIRVGDTYYMVSTTMFFSPGAPIMKSHDLVSWEICSYVYDTLANGDVQNLTNGKNDYAHGQWAASLRYHNGMFYVFFGSYGTGKSYIYKTDDIENGTWSKVELNGMYHDASMLFDDDGRNYLVYGGGGEIKIKEFNSDMTGFKSGGVDKTLFKTGLTGLAGEGSHVEKIGDYYYIFLIAWPNGSGRIELCYRSRDLLGTYENKTVLNSGLGSYGSGVAQGGIVDTPDGKWYGLLFQDHGAVGRIPVLVPVTWQNDWPIMGVNGKAPLTISTNSDYTGTDLAGDDDFTYSSNDLALEWQWNHNPDNSAWSVTEREGWLRLHNKTTATNILNARNTLTMRTEGPACSSYIKLDTKGMKAGDYAGLSAFQLMFGNIGVYVTDSGQKKIYMAENGGSDVAGSTNKIVAETNLSGDEVYLKADFKFNNVNSDGSASNNIDKANFYYSYDGSNWTKLGNELSMSYDLKLFTGYRSAIYSYATKSTGGYADIDFFEYDRTNWNGSTGSKSVNKGGNSSLPDENGYYFHDTFEGSTNSWTGRGSASVLTSGRTNYEGSEALLAQERTSAWNGASKALRTSTFKPGENYSFSVNAQFLDGGSTNTFYMKLQYTDGEGTVKYSPIAEGTALKGEWVQLANTSYTIPADASNMSIYVETADSTDNFYIDDAYGAVEGTVIKGAGEAAPIILGDVNSDGRITSLDIAAARGISANGTSNSRQKLTADVDKSGTVDDTDVSLINDFVLGTITEFPVAEPDTSEWDNYVETDSPQVQEFHQNAIYQMGNTTRLREKIAKAQSGEKVKLAYIGGSITEGGRTDTCYVAQSSKYFADTFGTGSNVSFINAGMSGTSSVVGLMRAQKDILNDSPDVIFIEFSVNDHPGESYEKSFEGLVRKCLSQPNDPAVIILINRSKGGYSSQMQMVKVGVHYDIPIISMDNALTKAFNSGLYTTDDYYTDEYHPHAAGAKLISDCIAYYYRQALKTVNKTGEYTIPSTCIYGDDFSGGAIADLSSLTNFNKGSFNQGNGYGTLPYSLSNSKNGSTPITFSTEGRGIILVYKANSSGMGAVNVTVNGTTTKISGNKQYTWGGPDADIAYMQSKSGKLDVTISMDNASQDFTIWGIGVVK